MDEPTGGFSRVYRTRDFVDWEVVDRDGEKVGSVADLLIDERGRVRFVDVEFGFPRKQHFLLPQNRLEWGERRFVLPGWTQAAVRLLPPYDPGQTLERPMLEEMQQAFPWMYDPEAEEWRGPAGEPRIVPLADAKDFRLEKGAPDLRGWNVFGSDGERVGTVSQMLVDPGALKVRYLDVDLLDDLFLLGDDRHVLVPLEFVELRERGNDAWVQGREAREVACLPAYTGGPVSPAMELALQRAWDAADDAAS